MRHREQSQPSPTQASPTADAEDGPTDPAVAFTELMETSRPKPGKHRAPGLPMPHVPAQKRPVPRIPTQASPIHEKRSVTPIEPVADVAPAVPETALWRASHLPRVFVGTLLALAAVGTSGLGVRYTQSRGSDDFVSLVIGLAVVVVLWAVLIASTPQVVRLQGSVLTVHNSGGTERFDLADRLQDVEVVGDPKTSHWAVLLHRPNNTTVVLRRHDVNASELDPIVRHFRTVAHRRGAERDARFSR